MLDFESLEPRRLCSSAPHSVPIPISANDLLVATAAPTHSTFTGQIRVTRSSGPLIINGSGIGTLAPNTTRPAQLIITSQTATGRLAGTFTVNNLGLAGPAGPFTATGCILRNRLSLNLTDNTGTATGKITATLSRGGRIISGTFTSRIFGETTRVALSLRFTPPNDLNTILGFQPLPPSTFRF